jgi:hypothetical protein
MVIMDYIMRNCPKCNKELPVPADLAECICMYCGEHFNIVEQPAVGELSEEPEVMEVDYRAAMEQIDALISNYDALLHKFTKDDYQPSFLEYTKLGEAILLPANRIACLSMENHDKVLNEISGKLIGTIEKNIEAEKGILFKKSEAVLIDQNRFFLAVYLIPMLSYLKLEIGDALADRIMADWKKRYPKSEFKKANYEELVSGFMRKGFCFITSAVCDSLNKPEDCYELKRFREFRDQYMMKSETGQKLVEEYYLTAPRIVTYLNMQTDSEERYRRIWSNFLQPCLMDIESGHKKRCRNRYVRMVRELNSQLPI